MKTRYSQDNKWLVSKSPDKNWTTPRVLGDAGSSPWRGRGLSQLLTPDEYKKFQRIQNEKNARLKVIAQNLKKEKRTKNTIVYKNSRPYIKTGDKVLPAFLYNMAHTSFEDYRFTEKIEEFKKSGCHFYTVHIRFALFWNGYDKYNNNQIDEINKTMLEILDIDPNARFMLCVTLDPGKWWIEQNPDELIGYDTGKSEYKASVFKRRKTASFASKKWQKETGQALKSFVNKINTSETASRVVAYNLCYGIYAEWHYYGMSKESPDNGQAMTGAFRKWLKKYYKNDEQSLKTKWNDLKVSFDNVTVPNAKERESIGLISLRTPKHDQKVLDFLRCSAKEVANCMLYFNKVVKNNSNDKVLTGNYYGYFFGMAYTAVGWHLELGRVLDSKYVDFLISPYCYPKFYRGLGGSGQIRTTTESYRLRKKLAILESDTRTHLNEAHGSHFAKNVNDSIALLSRDFCNALTNSTGLWYYDFGKNWYSDPKIYKYMNKIKDILKLDADNSSVSEVAVICDMESVPYSFDNKLTHTAFTANFSIINEVSKSGVPYDTLLFSDLAKENVKNYKVYIFINAVYMTPEKRKIVNDLKNNGKILVWNFAAGLITPKGISKQSMASLTGINIDYINATNMMQYQIVAKQYPLTKNIMNQKFPSRGMFLKPDGPVFYGKDKQALTLGMMKYKDKLLDSVLYKKHSNYTSIYSNVPFLSRQLLRNIYKTAGVNIYSNNNNDVVYANKSFVAIHTSQGGKRKIKFPNKVKALKQLLPQEKLLGENIDTVDIKFTKNSTVLLYLN